MDVWGLSLTELAYITSERSLITNATRDGIEGLGMMHTMALLEDGG